MGNSSDHTPRLIDGGIAVDDRGLLSHANSFTFAGVKRFYLVENFSPATVRAFHGHRREAKYALVVAGTALVAVVPFDDEHRPSKDSRVDRFVLTAKIPQLLYIPPGYANGFRALEEGTKIIFFCTATFEEAKGDDYRFPYDYWGKQVWEVKHR